ncbi:hypothetical protein [Methanobrevibacter sp.]|uniref:hypothetical protein n=1 Tax=Methanobrevibacter sp. TaxID=66852 RepID=UPI00388D21F3
MAENSLSKAGLEVYVTEPVEDPNVTAIGNVNMTGTANMVGDIGKSSGFTFGTSSETEEDEEETTTTSSNTDPSKNFVLQNGKILSIDYVGELFSDSFESDYKDISSNSSVSVPIEYLNLFFKGKKIALKKAWQNGILNWEHMETAILGFITELTWNKDKVDIKISGMDKLLEAEADLEFTQTKRSEVVKAIIEAAGLKAKVDVTGLIDDVIDFSTKSSSGSDEEGSGESTGSASIDEAVNKAIKGKKDPLDKAKAIDKAFKNHVFYSYYWDVHHPNLDEAWKNAHLNCADGANVLCAMFIKGGLNAVILHVPEHYIVKVTIKGKAYFTDNAASDGQHTTRPFGEVWRGNTSGSVVGTKIPG